MYLLSRWAADRQYTADIVVEVVVVVVVPLLKFIKYIYNFTCRKSEKKLYSIITVTYILYIISDNISYF